MGHQETIAERFEHDRGTLLPLPPAPLEACEKRTTRASSQAVVRYETNDYSVPTEYGHRQVLVKAFVWDLIISCGSEVIALLSPVSNARIFPGDVVRTTPFAWRLYLLESWANDREKRKVTGVPAEISFQTKPAIALAQIRQAVEQGVPLAPVLADSAYGNETRFREGITELGLRYVVGFTRT